MGVDSIPRKQTEKWATKGAKGGRGPKPKMTKEERRKKYTDIARKRRQKQEGNRRGGARRKVIVCYNCRMPGHSASECPSLRNDSDGVSNVCVPATVLCYKCGSTEHALHNCPKRHRGDRNDLPYATCFICNKKGHLASSCPENRTGIYVNGGSCRVCGSQQHLAANCPDKKRKKQDKDEIRTQDSELALVDDLIEENPSSKISKTKRDNSLQKKSKSTTAERKKKKRVVNF